MIRESVSGVARFRVGGDGQVLEEEDGHLVSGFNMETIRTVRSRLAESPLGNKISQAQGQAKRGLRKVVTGNPDKKVRDYMKEVPQVKLVDKLSFTWGVTCIVVTELLALRYPQFFTSFYLTLITALLANRSNMLETSKINQNIFSQIF